MEMPDMLDGMSMNLEQTNLEKLRAVFPECVSEGKLDIDKLLSLCGEYIDNDFEKYRFEWKGKAECLRLAQKRSTGTLRPCPEESVNWDTTQNLYIEGDNLEVLKLLQTAYYRKVKMIYIDPPYNTGNDFVYADDFADPLARYKEVTAQTTKSNPETMGRFHTNWLNMMYPRLRLAASLLRDDGVVFISIDHNLMIPENAQGPYHYRDNLIRFVAAGYDLPRTDSIKMELTGTWVNGKHGCQFQVEHWREIVPPTIPGIRAYLASGLLKGIGGKTADAIVERFGVDSLDVLEHHPEKLLEICGISEEKLEQIKSGYAESKALRELMTLLGPFKVTPATAIKIYQHFGAGGVELIRESPFRLCQVPGFGFKKVDAILRKSGADPHDPMRVQGALFYALEKSRGEGGHLYMETGCLIRSALKLLNEDIAAPEKPLTQQEVESTLETMILANIVVSKGGNIYLPHVYTEECETARKVVEISLEVPEPVDLRPVMEQVRRQLGITLSTRQAEGVEMVFRHNLSIITGGPGTGKSTILKAVVEAFRLLYPGRTISLAAPTGKASRRMAETTGVENAQTLHSLLGLFGESGSWRKKKELDTGLLIVDETSMVDMWLAHQLFARLRPGTKVLLVGDADQLESVGAGSVFQELIASGVVPVTVLDQIFRQAGDSRIAYNAKSINEGDSELLYGADFSFIRADTQEETAEMIRSLYKMEAAKTGIRSVEILSPYRSEGCASAQALNESIREEINPASPGKAEAAFGGKLFRLGDRVIQTKNNYDLVLKNRQGEETGKGMFNGELGTVRGIKPGLVCVEFDGRFATYANENLNELELAYAMTVHKAMGSEFEVVIIPMLAAHRILLTRNLFYTAVTRAKKRVVLVGQRKALFMAIAKTRKGKRNTLLAERTRLYQQNMTRKTVEKPPMKRAG